MPFERGYFSLYNIIYYAFLKGFFMNQLISKRYASIIADFCVACGSCEDVCPRGAARIIKGSCAAVDTELCVGCGQCQRVCPAGAVRLEVRA